MSMGCRKSSTPRSADAFALSERQTTRTTTITPKKWIPDYCEIDKFIREQLDGKSLVIEDAACKLKQWLTGEIHPYWVEVESDVTDGVHGHVTVTV